MGNENSTPSSPNEASQNSVTNHALIKSIKKVGDLYSANIKCVLLGCSGVGKTSFKSRFLWDEFKEIEDPTMGAIRHTTTKVVGRIKFNIELWDTGSVERYNSFVPMYMKDCACAIMFYDITDKDTFLKAVNLTKNVQNNAPEGTFILLTGNKVDLESRREVSKEDATEICQQLSISFIEMSCKANFNIQKPLQELTNAVEKIISEVPFKDEEPPLKTPPAKPRGIAVSKDLGGSAPPSPSLEQNGNVRPSHLSKDEFESSPFAKKVNDEYLFACGERVAKTAVCVPVELILTKTQIILENIQEQSSGYSILAPVEGLMRFLSRREYDFVEDDVTMRISVDAFHTQRFDIWVKRKIDGLSVDIYAGDDRDQYVEEGLTLLSPLRDLLIKCMKERLPSHTKFDTDKRSTLRSDFHRTYREHCKYLKLQPLRPIEDQILENKDTFTQLNLSKIARDPKHLVAVLEGMRWNASVSYLDISENLFGTIGLLPLCRVAHTLPMLSDLDLTDNKLGREGGVFVAGLLSSLPALRRLIVDKNGLADGAACIGAALSTNTSLTSLSLSQNNIGSDAALSFAKAFVVNTSLRSLDLSCNDITEEAGLPLSNSISCNATITRLCVLGNRELSEHTLVQLTLPKISYAAYTNNASEPSGNAAGYVPPNNVDDSSTSSGDSSSNSAENVSIGNAGTPQPTT